VIRDTRMKPFHEYSVNLGYLSGAFEAESTAMLWGLRRAAKFGLRQLRVRNDCAPLLHSLATPQVQTGTTYSEIVSQIRVVAASFESIQFKWTRSIHATVRGDGAHSADFLARRACGLAPRAR
jgi:hypothetical protein